MSTTSSKQRLNEMTENETNQRTITEEMNRKQSEMVGETAPGEDRSEGEVTMSEARGTCTMAMGEMTMGGYELLLWHRHTCRHHACCCACAELRQLRCLLRQLSRGQRLAACYRS